MKLPLSSRKYSEGKLKVCTRVNHDMILHKHYRAFLVFLQMKDLYSSGVIKNEGGKLPYDSLAKYLDISISGLRGKIRQLKKYELISIDKNKNLHLASYRKFVSVFKPQKFRRVQKKIYPNFAGADDVVKGAAVEKNFKAQAFMVQKKIINSEIKILVDAPKDRLTYPENGCGTLDECSQRNNYAKGSKEWHTFRKTKPSKRIRALKAELLKDYPKLLVRYEQYYAEELETINNGYPEINPHVTLSCLGLGRLLGLSSANGGYYQRSKMIGAGVLSVQNQNNYYKVFPVCQEAQQEIREAGGNVFSMQYPTRRNNSGFVEKFHLHAADTLKLNPFFS